MNIIKLCVIGNSHAAALKLGWDKIAADHPDIRATFFAARAPGIRELTLKQRCLQVSTPKVREELVMTSGGLGEIAIDDYDVFLIHGFFGFSSIVRHYIEAGTRPPTIESILSRSLAPRLAAPIEALNKAALLSPNPFVSEQVLGGDVAGHEHFGRQIGPNGQPVPDAARALADWNAYLDRHKMVVQPAETVCQHFFTRREYSTDSVRLTEGFEKKHPENDVAHMNWKYGVLVMKSVVERCRNLPVTETAQLRHRATEERKNHPYTSLPDYAYWRRTVGKPSPLEIGDWYRKKFDIDSLRIATAGSCFAQHIGHRLKQQGFNYLDVEPAPSGLAPEACLENGYGMYSARYGNIYTPRQLRQLLERALGRFAPVDSAWKKDGGYVDPFRPTIQPTPYASIEELEAARRPHLAAVRELFAQTDVFIFTLGLTETWEALADGAVFPVAPGVSGGDYDPDKYRFRNLSFSDTLEDMRQFIKLARGLNPKMKFLLTVSPVPLMATASSQQIVVATSYSKAVLRAVAGQLAGNNRHVDYFPSFEIISSHVMGNQFYEEDMRSVRECGVDHVMEQFFREHIPPMAGEVEDEESAIHCDEELLAAFGQT